MVYCHTLLIGYPVFFFFFIFYVIESPELNREFTKFCSLEFCIENLLFHNRVTQFKKEMEDYEKDNQKQEEKKITTLYDTAFEESDIDIIDDYYRETDDKNNKVDDNQTITEDKHDYIPEIFIQEAIEIYKKFISHDSIFEINIPNSTYQKIKKELDDPQRHIPKTIFDKADTEVLNNLYHDTYQKFLKYQKDMKNFNVLEVYTNNQQQEIDIKEQI